jgi:hypothetical protein
LKELFAKFSPIINWPFRDLYSRTRTWPGSGS